MHTVAVTAAIGPEHLWIYAIHKYIRKSNVYAMCCREENGQKMQRMIAFEMAREAHLMPIQSQNKLYIIYFVSFHMYLRLFCLFGVRLHCIVIGASWGWIRSFYPFRSLGFILWSAEWCVRA